jgi:hypothetical protein
MNVFFNFWRWYYFSLLRWNSSISTAHSVDLFVSRARKSQVESFVIIFNKKLDSSKNPIEMSVFSVLTIYHWGLWQK